MLRIAKPILIKSWPYVAIIVAHTIWGVNFLAAKFALQEFPPMTLAFLRFFLALILLSPFLLTEKRKIDNALSCFYCALIVYENKKN